MRAVADTNLIVSAFLWGGNPRRVIDAARDGVFELFTSPALLAELEGVIKREKFERQFLTVGFTPEDLIAEFVGFAIVIDAEPIEPFVIRDPDDDMVVAAAIASQSNVIVSGDDDLLDLKQYQDIRILTATELLSELTL